MDQYRLSRRAPWVRPATLPTVSVNGEDFDIRPDDTLGIVLERHPWSLIGVGRTVAEAVRDLRQEARALAEVMKNDDAKSDLDFETTRMRQFALESPERWDR